ncbi:MAG: hypothetical protein CEN92_120 [Candidatus Berkelbacteria bacterium Licking1014_96]|uniref:Uncharacterized protein n=1 Tax=Candidatus Berkelbacteria bacterium Licking1014_96 TaxID=2017149 RepID=A0A554LGV5_9BACT|nr:MAG: hypothetical protein CEN92_120 [Candidatus Berkelbacteria bacterium Licking1014_96]
MHLVADITASVVLTIMIAGILVYILRRISEPGLPKGQKSTLGYSIVITMLYSLPSVLLLSFFFRSPHFPPWVKLCGTLVCFIIWLIMTINGIVLGEPSHTIYLLPKERYHIGWLIRFGRVEFLNAPLPMSRLRAFFGLYHFSSGFFGPRTITRCIHGQGLSVDLVIKARPGGSPTSFVLAKETIPGQLENYLLSTLDDLAATDREGKVEIVRQELSKFRPASVVGRKVTIQLHNTSLERRDWCGDIEIEIDDPS